MQNNAGGMDPYAIAGKPTTPGEVLQSAVVGAVSGAVSGLVGPEAGPVAKVAVGALANGVGQMAGNALSGKPLMDGVGEAVVSGAITGGVMEGAGSLLEGMGGKVLGKIASAVEGSCSFTPTTQVTTAQGKQAIGTLQVGQSVLAYNPKTRRMETEPILHVWIHPDSDLVDLTISTPIHAPHSTQVTWTRETLHTNQKHPFFTLERGFTAVGQLKQGMNILRADGRVGIITGWVRVPGTRIMYNLEVAHDHTFTVGAGQWVVHNACSITSGGRFLLGPYRELANTARVLGITDDSVGYQAHHIYQDAMMRDLPNYSRDDAPAILLLGGSGWPGTPHDSANLFQRSMASGLRFMRDFFGVTTVSFDTASAIASDTLTTAGLNGDENAAAMDYASSYFRNRWSNSQLDQLTIPGGRGYFR